MSRLRAVAIALSGALASMLFCLACMVGHAESVEAARAQGYDEGYTKAESAQLSVVTERPVPEGTHMPLWLQTDPQWSYIPYAGGTIGTSGCGLTAAAMALKYMTLQEVTPLQLAEAVGDSCLTGGVNDPSKFCSWIAEHYAEYRVESGGRAYRLDDALAAVDDGWLVMAGMSGTLGDATYDGHVVLIWRHDDEGYWVRDPDSGANSARAFSRDELGKASWGYFDKIKGGLYGA